MISIFKSATASQSTIQTPSEQQQSIPAEQAGSVESKKDFFAANKRVNFGTLVGAASASVGLILGASINVPSSDGGTPSARPLLTIMLPFAAAIGGIAGNCAHRGLAALSGRKSVPAVPADIEMGQQLT